MIRRTIAATLLVLSASYAEATCTSSGFATICVDKPTMPSGGGGGGGGYSSGGSSRRSAGPTVDRRAQEQRRVASQATSIRQEADSALNRGRYQDAIDLYDKALNAYYTKANKEYYDGRKLAARQAWLDDKWNDVERALRDNRYEDLSAELKAVQKIWFTKELEKKINQIDKVLADRREAEKRALADSRRATRAPATDGTALTQLRQAVPEQQGAAKNGMPSNAPYDTASKEAPAALAVVAAPNANPVTRLAGSIGVKLDLNKPENNDVVQALSQVNYMLQYNQKAKDKASGFKPDEKAYKQRVDDLNKVLQAHGSPPVKPAEVEKKYESFSALSISVADGSTAGDPKAGDAKAGAATPGATSAGGSKADAPEKKP